MKLKTSIISVLFIFSTITVDAQVKKWFNNKLKDFQKNKYVKKIEESGKNLDPSIYIIKKINENFYIAGYVSDIKTYYGEINKTLYNEVSLINPDKYVFLNDFSKTEYPANNLEFFDKRPVDEEFLYPIEYNNSKFQLYRVDDFIFATSETKFPIDNDLENIIKTGLWASHTKNINSSYLVNLKSFSKLNGELYGSLLFFYDQCILIFDKINGISYAGMTATELIDSYSKNIGSSFTMTTTKSNFKSLRNELKEMQNISNRINRDCNTILDAKENLIKTGNIKFSDVQNSLSSFSSIATDINILANQVENQKRIITNSRFELSKLSNFYGISFIESIGDLYQYLGNYYSIIETQTRNHSIDFNNFVENIDSYSNRSYNISKSSFAEITDKQINEELKHIDDYLQLLKDIQNSDFKNKSQNNFVSYLNKIDKLYSDLLHYQEIDFLKFTTIKNELSESYNSFPVSDAENYYNSILVFIDEEQIIGGNNLESHSDSFKANIFLVNEDRAKITKLLSSNKNLNSYYEKAKTNNLIFYFFSMAIIILVIITILMYVRKNKHENAQLAHN